MKYIFEIIWICWFLSEFLINRFFRSKLNESKILDRNSLQIIWITIIASLSFGILSCFYLCFPISETNTIRYIGLVLIVAGMVIRFLAIRTLGKFFTANLAIHAEHKLVKQGLYKYIRHPSYFGSLLSFIGFGLTLNNWISLFIILIPVLISFIYRIYIEEKLLSEQIGLEYDDYKKNTKKLLPYIY
jgi:protein-S-isoprenylcysteine O-methyltransferase Ste14